MFETVIAAVLLLHERSVVSRCPSCYPPGTLKSPYRYLIASARARRKSFSDLINHLRGRTTSRDGADPVRKASERFAIPTFLQAWLRFRPASWPGEMVRQEIFKDAVPWIVIRVYTKPWPGVAA
jgi:hypothetical protein